MKQSRRKSIVFNTSMFLFKFCEMLSFFSDGLTESAKAVSIVHIGQSGVTFMKSDKPHRHDKAFHAAKVPKIFIAWNFDGSNGCDLTIALSCSQKASVVGKGHEFIIMCGCFFPKSLIHFDSKVLKLASDFETPMRSASSFIHSAIFFDIINPSPSHFNLCAERCTAFRCNFLTHVLRVVFVLCRIVHAS